MEKKELHMNLFWQDIIKEELYKLTGSGQHQPQEEEVKQEPVVLSLREQIAAMMQQNLHILQEESFNIINKPETDRFPL
jgi:hypothetical protein